MADFKLAGVVHFLVYVFLLIADRLCLSLVISAEFCPRDCEASNLHNRFRFAQSLGLGFKVCPMKGVFSRSTLSYVFELLSFCYWIAL